MWLGLYWATFLHVFYETEERGLIDLYKILHQQISFMAFFLFIGGT